MPRSWFKRARPLNRQQPVHKQHQALIRAFDNKDVGKHIRRSMWEGIAENIVNATRAAHINITMDGWKRQRANGNLTGRVAIIVDGSPQRPIRNVKFAGVIQIVAPANANMLIEAAFFALQTIVKHAQAKGHKPGYSQKKNNSFNYVADFRLFLSDEQVINQPRQLLTLAENGGITENDWVSIFNGVPYAAKLERQRYPDGSYWYTYKKLRSKYGKYLAIRFDYVESTEFTQAGTKGRRFPVPQPVIRIGQPGAFPSRAPNMRKLIRDQGKRKIAQSKGIDR